MNCPALTQNRIDALLCDQMEAAGGLVAEALDVPFISVACALPVNREPGIALAVMPFAYGTDERSRRLYEGSQRVYDWLMRPLRDVIRAACREFAIEPRDALHQCLCPTRKSARRLPDSTCRASSCLRPFTPSARYERLGIRQRASGRST